MGVKGVVLSVSVCVEWLSGVVCVGVICVVETGIPQRNARHLPAVVKLAPEDIVHGLEPEVPVPYTHLRAHENRHDLVCRLLLEKKK